MVRTKFWNSIVGHITRAPHATVTCGPGKARFELTADYIQFLCYVFVLATVTGN